MKNFLEKVQENGPEGRKKIRQKRVTGLGGRTREEIVKWDQMTVLGFQTGGTPRHPLPPFGGASSNTEDERLFEVMHRMKVCFMQYEDETVS